MSRKRNYFPYNYHPDRPLHTLSATVAILSFKYYRIAVAKRVNETENILIFLYLIYISYILCFLYYNDLTIYIFYLLSHCDIYWYIDGTISKPTWCKHNLYEKPSIFLFFFFLNGLAALAQSRDPLRAYNIYILHTYLW